MSTTKSLLIDSGCFACGAILLLGSYGTAVAGKDRPQPKAIDIGSRLELFVDSYLIDKLDGAELKLHPLKKAPESQPTAPAAGYNTILKDGNLFRLYGRGYLVPGASWRNVGGEAGFLNEVTVYAESSDGIHWKEPKLKIYELQELGIDERLLEFAKQNNIEVAESLDNVVMAGEFTISHNFTPFIDTKPGVPAGQKCKAVGGHYRQPEYIEKYGPAGLYAFVSPDGIHWKQFQEQPIIPAEWGKFDSQNLVFWSELEEQYVAYFRFFHQGKRAIRRSTSKDFIHWTEPAHVDANMEGEQLYTNNVHPYFRAPHIYVAPATRYVAGQRPNTFVILMTSRDGVHFDRTFGGQTFKETLTGDRTNYINWTSTGVQTGAKELSYYDHQGNRYILRLDGYASLHADDEEGQMVTRPLVFDGKELRINARVGESGFVRVEVQNVAGEPIDGFTLTDSQPFSGDEICYAARFAGGDLSQLAGKPIRLRFVMQNADVYALRFE